MYTVWALTAVVAVLAGELIWARTGILRRPAYWVTVAITGAFQVPVDGWLTKLSAPIVIYNPHELSGLRLGWGTPVEDFAYGFALVTLTLTLWVKAAAGEGTAANGHRRRRAARRRPVTVRRARSRYQGGTG